jgi:hypothetical protein
VVDNSEGADPGFVADLHSDLAGAGFEVETRGPKPQSMFDTTVHFIVEGVSVRVPEGTSRDDLEVVLTAIRTAQARRGEHQRFRAVPIYRADTNHVLAWADVFA